MKYFGQIVAFASLSFTSGLSASETRNLSLTEAEKSDIEERLNKFYSHAPEAMNDHIPKFSLRTKKFRTNHNQRLFSVGDEVQENPLNKNAGIKSSRSYRQASCANANNLFAKSPCAGDSENFGLFESFTGDDNNKFQTLVDGWLATELVAHDLSTIPTTADVAVHPWSDDYWRLKWGGISYRLSSEAEFPTYAEAIASYAQPKSWEDSKVLSPVELEETVTSWSAAEKYDLITGDLDFGLTLEQKAEGAKEADEDGNVPDWAGICDGWAAAGIMVPSPQKPVDVVGTQNMNVHMTPSDVRALTSLAWARGSFQTNMLGSRCESENPETYPNGRVSDDSCVDTNPAAFHLAVGNMIGIAKKSFVMDASFDGEVWNQPVVSYQFTYFNPLDPTKRDKDWTKVAVDYDSNFKAKDRFQSPMTRGVKKRRGKWNDDAVKKVVGVIATITYADEAIPSVGDEAPEENDVRVTYIYDLEFSDVGGKLFAKGGEWYNNTHPDFLWVPKVESVAKNDDDQGIYYSPSRAPTKKITTLAKTVSANGSPICSVLSSLVNASTNKGTYPSCGPMSDDDDPTRED